MKNGNEFVTNKRLDKAMEALLGAMDEMINKWANKFNGKLDAIDEKFERRFIAIETRMDNMDSRLDNMDSRLDKIDNKLDERFDKLEDMILGIKEKVDFYHPDTPVTATTTTRR